MSWISVSAPINILNTIMPLKQIVSLASVHMRALYFDMDTFNEVSYFYFLAKFASN